MLTSAVLLMVAVAVGTSQAAVFRSKIPVMNQGDEEEPMLLRGLTLDSDVEAPKHCCTPVQWEGVISGFVAYKEGRFSRAKTVEELINISYDGTNKRIAMNGTIVQEGKPKHFRVIELFQKKKMYVIDDDGNCVSHGLPVAFKPLCVPDNATYAGSYSLGLGTESLRANLWYMRAQGFHVLASVTPQQCVPLSEEIWGRSEEHTKFSMLGLMGYANLSKGIKSKTIFTPPKDCPPAHSQLGDGLMNFMHMKFQ